MPLDANTKQLLQKYFLQMQPEGSASDPSGGGPKLLRMDLKGGTPPEAVKQIQEGIAKWFSERQTPANIIGNPAGSEPGNIDIGRYADNRGITIAINEGNIKKSQQALGFVAGSLPYLDQEIRAAAKPAPRLTP